LINIQVFPICVYYLSERKREVLTMNQMNVTKPKALVEKIEKIVKLAPDIFKITISSQYVSQNALPGQFINIRCSEGMVPLLRRPISICDTNIEKGTFDIVFGVRGKGTELLSRKTAGEYLDFTGPLGNSFDIDEKYKSISVVGGGIGIFPLLFALRKSKALNKNSYLGFRSKDYVILEEEFRNISDLCVSTDDGSYANCGLVTIPFEKAIKNEKPDIIYACGPAPMIKAVVATSASNNIKCQISLEENMGCGIGACLVCVCKTKLGEGFKYSHVCKDGPVFWSDEVIL
jgi:dihydroorotate dehydrogenase electron transfer subunit